MKLDVYRPDWTDARRVAHTLDCAAVLADLLPEGGAGSISTLPLGWRDPWTADDDRRRHGVARARVARAARAPRARPGARCGSRSNPSPAACSTPCTTWSDGSPRAPGSGEIDPEFVGVCLDTCHLAVSFADPADAVREIADAGLRVVKVQASAALHVERPSDPRSREAVAAFIEPRYLHQTRELRSDGTVLATDDLAEALELLPAEGPWRVHFHVPLHLAPRAPLTATTDVLRDARSTPSAASRTAMRPTSTSRPTPGPCCPTPSTISSPGSPARCGGRPISCASAARGIRRRPPCSRRRR